MNVSSAMPPVSGSAVATAPPGVTSAPVAGGGLADLFAALLASLQGSLADSGESVVASAAAQGSGDSAGEAVTEALSVALATATVETPDEDQPEAAVPQEGSDESPLAEESGEAMMSMLKVQPDVAPLPIAAEPVTADATAPVPVATPKLAGATVVQAVALPGDVTGDGGVEAKAAPVSDSEIESGPVESLRPTASIGRAMPASVVGAAIVESVRQGQAQASLSNDAPPGRTVRELVQQAVAAATGQEGSAATTETPATIATAKQMSSVMPELRPAGPETAPKPAAPAFGLDVAPSGGEVKSAEGVRAESNGPPRAALPQSVDVHDVGDFTVKTVRYLNGRTEDVVTVRLVPRSLGELQIAVRHGADGLDVVMTTATHAARERLEGQLGGLRELFAREGMDVNRVTVQTQPAFDVSGQMPSGHQHQNQTGQPARFSAPPARQPEANPPEQQQAIRSARPQHEGGLNMLA